jgi:hypothetical protein
MSDQWEIVEFPAIINDKPMWGNFWTMDGLHEVKASIPLTKWQAQWMQQPTSEEGALIKREWWQTWGRRKRFQIWNSSYSHMTRRSVKKKRPIIRRLRRGEFLTLIMEGKGVDSA